LTGKKMACAQGTLGLNRRGPRAEEQEKKRLRGKEEEKIQRRQSEGRGGG